MFGNPVQGLAFSASLEHEFLRNENGNDMLTGGSGADMFAFKATGGHDTVTDYSLEEDSLNLRSFGFGSLADVQATASESVADGQSGLRLDLSPDASVFLVGLSAVDLAVTNILF